MCFSSFCEINYSCDPPLILNWQLLLHLSAVTYHKRDHYYFVTYMYMYLLLHLVSIQYYSWRIFYISLGSLLHLAPIFKYVFSAELNFMYKFLCNVQEVIAQTRDKEAASMTEVSWRGRTVPVKNEKVRSFILHAQQSARELDRAETLDSKLTLYDDLLMECKDALQAIKDELKVDTVSSDFLLLKFLIPNTQVLDLYETAVALYTCVKLVKFKQCVSQSEKTFSTDEFLLFSV